MPIFSRPHALANVSPPRPTSRRHRVRQAVGSLVALVSSLTMRILPVTASDGRLRTRDSTQWVPRTVLSNAAARVLAGSLVLVAAASCTSALNVHGDGDHVALLVTGTAHEPRPMLTTRALQELRDAANSTNVTDGPGGKSSSASITTADDQFLPAVSLTPRRANGAVEHGLQRSKLIEDNLQQVIDTVSGVTATQPGMDLLEGMNAAVRDSDHGVLVVISNGLSTRGGFDLRVVGWNADPVRIASQLREQNLLPDLTGWRVLWTGLAATVGSQPSLPKPIREKLGSYWTAICEAAGAASCNFDEARLDPTPPTTLAEMPIVPIPEITSVIGPSGKVTSLPDALLGFGPDSAVLAPAAAEVIGQVAADIATTLAGQPEVVVTSTGYTADPPGSTPVGRQQLSLARAQAVADALIVAGVTQTITVVGGGVAPETTAMQDGVFVEAAASRMRRTEISY